MDLPNTSITPIPAIDPATGEAPGATPDLFNARFLETTQNFEAVSDEIDANSEAVAAANERVDQAFEGIVEQSDRITTIENNSAGSVSEALRLDWLYRSDQQLALELFYDSWTLIPVIENMVVDAVAGDDSLDMDSVEGLTIGEEYVIWDDNGHESVIIKGILTDTRIRITENLSRNFTNAAIGKTSWDIPGGKAVATDGGRYYSGPVNLGDDNRDKALIIRRDDNDAEIEVYFKDTVRREWGRIYWTWLREISEGVVDVEYLLPARETFEVKIISINGDSGVEPEIYNMAFVDAETGLKGIHHPPLKPALVYPSDGATDIGEQPSLTTEAYTHLAESSMYGAEFQISTAADFDEDAIVDESGVIQGISYSPDKDVLSPGTAYYARARHVDAYAATSEWSATVSFTTISSFVSINKPSVSAPANGDELDSPDGLTLVSSAFSTEGGSDTHINSQWQIASDPGFAAIVYDSGETTDLTSHNVPDGTLARANTYYCRVCHQGSAEGWSDWSDAVMFSVADFTTFVTILDGIANEQFTAVAKDNDGNIYAAGYTDSIDNSQDPFLAKFGIDGALVWQKRLDGSGDNQFLALAVDDDGNIYAAGYEETGSPTKPLVMKFTPEGTLSWQMSLTAPGTAHFLGVTVHGSAVYAVGYMIDSTVTHGFIAKFSTSGSFSWAKTLGGASGDRFRGVAVDLSGKVYAAGYERSSNGKTNALLAKFSATGGVLFQLSMIHSGGYDSEFIGVAVADDGSVYAAGCQNELDRYNEAFLCKFSSGGDLTWQQSVGGTKTDEFLGVSVDEYGDIYTAGYSKSDIHGTYSAPITAKFSSAGTLNWMRTLYGSVGTEEFTAVAASGNGAYLAGFEKSSGDQRSALLASVDRDAVGTSDTVPGITTLTWGNAGLQSMYPSLTSSDPGLTLAAPSITAASPGLSLSTINLTQTLSEY